MTNKDLLDALSGIDSKYIDEAAFELHEADVVDITSARRTRLRKFIYIALPSVAAILLIVGVAFPAIMRVAKTDNAAPAAEAPAADYAAASDEPVAESAEATTEEALADEAPAAESEAAQSAPAMAENAAKTEAAAESAPAAEAEDTAAGTTLGSDSTDKKQSLTYEGDVNTAGETGPAAREEAAMEVAEEAEEMPVEEAEENEDVEVYDYSIEEAVYKKGKLTLTISGSLPDDPSLVSCTIIKTDTKPVSSIYAGTLSDLIVNTDPLTLDLTELELTEGSYRAVIGGPDIDFTIKRPDI
ncbi:MAG: hypothetical protein K6F28_05800 [Lachnospiraceae bacterium]|nr:hypothetical protein [Lachnospiraceae bacterium]